ncbi:MAG: hypothetical protein WC455_09505 [Dehalococcoidia bacterium]|jgi:hypothetical protein
MRTCGECRHFKPGIDPEQGYCKRYPPKADLIAIKPPKVAGGNPVPEVYTHIPPVKKSQEACGEFSQEN